MKGKISKIDPSVFYWYERGQLIGILAVHVDDFLWAGSKNFEENVVSKIKSIFEIGKEQSISFQYIGLEIKEDDDCIILSQRQYCETIEEIQIEKRDLNSLLSENEKSIMRAKLGQLLWVSKQSRPDIAFDVTDLAGRLHNSTINEIKRLNKIIKRTKLENVELKFQNLGTDLEITLYSDASFGNLHDGGSQGGYFIALRGKDGKINPITWQSRRLKRVTKSTLASETLALSEGIDHAYSIAMLFGEMLNNDCNKTIPIRCYVDNGDLVESVKSSKSVQDKRLRIEVASIKQMLERKEITSVQWVGTKDQIANCLTKGGASPYDLLNCLKYGEIPVN